MKAKVLSKIIRLEEYVRLVARAVTVGVCPLCGARLEFGMESWGLSYREFLVCVECGFKHIIGIDVIQTVFLNQISEDQMTIDSGEEKPPLTKI